MSKMVLIQTRNGLYMLQACVELKHVGRDYHPTCSVAPFRCRLQIVSAR